MVFGFPLRRLFAFHFVALPAGAALLLRDARHMVTTCMSVTAGTAKTVITAMRSMTTTAHILFAEHGTGGATEAPESVAGSAHDMGSVPAELGKPDTQGFRTAHEDSDAVAT